MARQTKINALIAPLAGTAGVAGKQGARVHTMLEIVDTMLGGPQFKSYTFEVDQPGVVHSTILRDFVFPLDSFEYLSMNVAKGARLLGTVQGSGGFTFTPAEAGTYTVLVFGMPDKQAGAGSYGVSVSAIPGARNMATFMSSIGLGASRQGRRVTDQPVCG